MKKALLTIIIIAIALGNATAQKTVPSYPVKGLPIKVLRWGSKSDYMVQKFWQVNEPSIIKQIGKAETADFKKFCTAAHSPLPKGLADRFDKDSTMFPKYAFEKLQLEMIGSFINQFNKKYLIKKAIVRIPYSKNVGVVEDAVWEGNLYFMIDYADIKIIKTKNK